MRCRTEKKVLVSMDSNDDKSCKRRKYVNKLGT